MKTPTKLTASIVKEQPSRIPEIPSIDRQDRNLILKDRKDILKTSIRIKVDHIIIVRIVLREIDNDLSLRLATSLAITILIFLSPPLD